MVEQENQENKEQIDQAADQIARVIEDYRKKRRQQLERALGSANFGIAQNARKLLERDQARGADWGKKLAQEKGRGALNEAKKQMGAPESESESEPRPASQPDRPDSVEPDGGGKTDFPAQEPPVGPLTSPQQKQAAVRDLAAQKKQARSGVGGGGFNPRTWRNKRPTTDERVLKRAAVSGADPLRRLIGSSDIPDQEGSEPQGPYSNKMRDIADKQQSGDPLSSAEKMMLAGQLNAQRIQRRLMQQDQDDTGGEESGQDANYRQMSLKRFAAFGFMAFIQDLIPLLFDLLAMGWLVNYMLLPITWAAYWYIIIRRSPKSIRKKLWKRSILFSTVGLIPIVGEFLPEWIAVAIGSYILIRGYETGKGMSGGLVGFVIRREANKQAKADRKADKTPEEQNSTA